MPALWGTFRGFPREYLTPAHVCLLSRILFGYPCIPSICPALRGPRKRSWRFGVHFAIPIARNPRLFVYCPEYHSGLLSTLLRDSPPPLLGAAQSTNSSEHSERSPCAADLHPSTSLLPLLRSTVSHLACPDSRHLFSARGIPDNARVMGCISRLSPRISYARSCLFIVPNIFGFTLDTVERLSSPSPRCSPIYQLQRA